MKTKIEIATLYKIQTKQRSDRFLMLFLFFDRKVIDTLHIEMLLDYKKTYLVQMFSHLSPLSAISASL